VATAFNAEAATGTGPNGTVTVCDVIGTATDHWDFAARLDTVTEIINPAIPTAFSTALSTLEGIYADMSDPLIVIDDAAMIALITDANDEIETLRDTYPTQVAELNTASNYIANYLNLEKGFQNQAALNYFELVSDEKVSVYALAQSLGQFGTQCQACGPNQFLQDIVDQTTLTGQAVIGALREGQNQAQLSAAGLQVDITPSVTPEITPPCAVNPVT
jgi:hypothetical protein